MNASIDRQRMRDTRKRLGLTQKQLADGADVSLSLIYKCEVQGYLPAIKTLKLIARVLKLRVDDLVIGDEGASRTTVWMLGSYSPKKGTITKRTDEELRGQVARSESLIRCLAGELMTFSTIRVVMGKSDLLQEFAGHFLSHPTGDRTVPAAIMLYGKLRGDGLENLFRESIGTIPDIAFVIGGNWEKGRVKEEFNSAERIGVPVFPIKGTGGAAARLPVRRHKLSAKLQRRFRLKSFDAGNMASWIADTVRIYGGR